MARVRIVLVRPETSANVGAAARAIANTGLEGLDLVAPCDWRTVDAWRMAWRAEDILEQARVFDDLPSALAASQWTAAVTGKPGGRVRPVTVRELAREIAALASDTPVSLVFGPESKGLPEREALLCQRRARIPAHPRQPSLNLAQAVMVTAYEVFLACGEIAPAETAPWRAPAAEVERALAALRDALTAIGFLPVEKPEARFVEWRALFGRAGLSPRECRIVLALARKIRALAARALSRP